jgi:hypothetical protein
MSPSSETPPAVTQEQLEERMDELKVVGVSYMGKLTPEELMPSLDEVGRMKERQREHRERVVAQLGGLDW